MIALTLKVLGLTATPYRLGMEWIYNYFSQPGEKGRVRTEQERFFKDCVFELPLSYMVDNCYLTPPVMVDAPVAWYDFSRLPQNQNGGYREGDLNQLLEGAKRATAAIIQQVVKESEQRQGAIISHRRESRGRTFSKPCL